MAVTPQGLEKYLLVKLHDRTFGVEQMDRERDEVISTRMRALQVSRSQEGGQERISAVLPAGSARGCKDSKTMRTNHGRALPVGPRLTGASLAGGGPPHD